MLFGKICAQKKGHFVIVEKIYLQNYTEPSFLYEFQNQIFRRKTIRFTINIMIDILFSVFENLCIVFVLS